MATRLWEHRYLLFKADDRLNDEEREQLTQILEADEKVGTLRAFLGASGIFLKTAKTNSKPETLSPR